MGAPDTMKPFENIVTKSFTAEHYQAIQSAIKDLTALLLKGQSQTDREKIYEMLAGLTASLGIIVVSEAAV